MMEKPHASGTSFAAPVGRILDDGMWRADGHIYCRVNLPAYTRESDLFVACGGSWYSTFYWPALAGRP